MRSGLEGVTCGAAGLLDYPETWQGQETTSLQITRRRITSERKARTLISIYEARTTKRNIVSNAKVRISSCRQYAWPTLFLQDNVSSKGLSVRVSVRVRASASASVSVSVSLRVIVNVRVRAGVDVLAKVNVIYV